MGGLAARSSHRRVVDELDRARAREYALLATLLARGPDAQLIGRLASLGGDATPLGMTHAATEDFEHPSLPEGHPLRRHVLYRLERAEWRGAAR